LNEKCCASKEEEGPQTKQANKKIRFVVMLKTIKNKGLQQGMPIKKQSKTPQKNFRFLASLERNTVMFRQEVGGG